MSDNASRRRQWITGTNAVVVVAAIIGIAIVVNAISSQLFTRLDMTEDQIYTLSPASQEAVENLDEPVTVHAYISQDLPAPMHNLAQRVRDLLTEYSAASDGKLRFEVISPGDNKQAQKNAKGDGCQQVAVGKQSKDQVSMRAVYKCVAFIKGEQREVLKDLKVRGRNSRGNFEYEFTKSLLNLQKTEPSKLGFVSGFGGPVSKRGFMRSIRPTFEQLFGGLIEPTKVDLSGENPSIPDDVNGLVVLNAKKQFSGPAKYAIDQFLQDGGSLGWFQSSTGQNKKMRQKMMQQMQGQRPPSVRKPLKTGLRNFIKFYGLEHRQDLVLDRKNAMTGLSMTKKGLARVSQPATFRMTDLDTSLPFMQGFTTLALPAPASIAIQPSARDNDSIDVYELIRTDSSAARRPDPPKSFSNSKFMQEKPSEKSGPFTVAAALQGDLPSYYDENPVPKGVSENNDPNETTSANSRLLVVGSGNFFRPQKDVGYNRKLAQLGGQFFVNSLEWLAQDNALTKIRTKSLPRLVGDVSYATKRQIQIINIALVPAVFALIGVFMFFRRRNRKDKLSEDV